jgi:hypothetical protein
MPHLPQSHPRHPEPVKDLSARQTVVLTQELRACLDELVEDKSTLT